MYEFPMPLAMLLVFENFRECYSHKYIDDIYHDKKDKRERHMTKAL